LSQQGEGKEEIHFFAHRTLSQQGEGEEEDKILFAFFYRISLIN
jgi:hypothetical protein